MSTAKPLPKSITQPKSRSASATELSTSINTLAGIYCSLPEQPRRETLGRSLPRRAEN